MKHVLICITMLLLPLCAAADEPEKPSFVKLPLLDYNRLVDASREPRKDPRPAPTSYALGKASLSVKVSEDQERTRAMVTANLEVKILEDEWTAVPILPAGTAVSSARVNGVAVELNSGPGGLLWSERKAGSYVIELMYAVDGARSERGMSLSLPVPTAAAITLEASLPTLGTDIAVVPAAATEVIPSGNLTIVKATIPSTTGVQLSWRTPGRQGAAISRAHYTGQLTKDGIIWKGELLIDVADDQSVPLKIMQRDVTLREVKLDNANAPLTVIDDFFATRVKGKGAHTITLEFQTPIDQDDETRHALVPIPQIPISRFDLSLPGKKELIVTPVANVSRTEENGRTLATFFVPMTEHVEFSWNEAVPDEIKEELRSNATVIHSFIAEEGVLSGIAYITYEVTRGETNVLELEVGNAVQINRISADGDIITDWRVTNDGDPNVVTVFLNRQLKDAISFEVHYDRSIVDDAVKAKLPLPLLKVKNVQRQRGMVALLSSKELTLKPLEESAVTKVGENQLPAEIRQHIDKTIAHTYKYVEDAPKLVVQATKPDRTEGRFDAEVNTLVSLTDVTLKGSATVDVNVKSGNIGELKLKLPKNINVLSLTAPSLRTYKVDAESEQPGIDVQFTQDMEGQFRIEVAYERIMGDGDADLSVPTLSVAGAEVEQGRIAVEALSAVEVSASTVRQLSSLEPTELPQQLVLKTTNPILLAYKYVHVDPPFELSLRITRHKEIDIQSATIDDATYRTLITEDGLAVTSASFMVRNSRQQFLKVQLPNDSKVWSAFVDGKPEKPALGTGSEEDSTATTKPQVLIKIINSSQGFPVQIIYQTAVAKTGGVGVLTGVLPRPDMVVTNTRWEVYLPDSKSYGKPSSNLTLVEGGTYLSKDAIEQEVRSAAPGAGGQILQPLHINVPTAGVRYTFEKLYANQAQEDPYFSIAYTSKTGRAFTVLVLLAGTALFWFALGKLLLREVSIADRSGGGALAAGLGMVLMVGWYLGLDYTPALALSAVCVVFGIVYWLKKLLAARKPATIAVTVDSHSDAAP